MDSQSVLETDWRDSSPGKGYSFPVDIWALGICFYFMLYQGAAAKNPNRSLGIVLLKIAIFDAKDFQ